MEKLEPVNKMVIGANLKYNDGAKQDINFISFLDFSKEEQDPLNMSTDMQIDPDILKLKGQIMDRSSQLDNRLKDVLSKYFTANPSKVTTKEMPTKFLDKLDDDNNIESSVRSVDFMTRKGILSSLLKNSDKHKSTTKPQRKLLNDFVLERNKYAHGVLCLDSNGFHYLKYQQSGNDVYAPLSISILNSFLDTYFKLDEWIGDINKDFYE